MPRLLRTPLLSLILIAAVPSWTLAQRGGANSPFPGGENPDGSLKPSGRLQRLFSQDACTEYLLLEPGSEQFRIRFLTEKTRAGPTELVNATRGGSEGTDGEGYCPRRDQAAFRQPERPKQPVDHSREQDDRDADANAVHGHVLR